MSKPSLRNQSGYIALLAVLIVGATATAIGLVLLTTSIDSQRTALVEQRSQQARVLAIACAEEALQAVHDNTSYTGTTNVTIGSDTCSYTVASTGANTRTITTSATVSDITRKIQAYVTIETLNISITSWQDVS